MSGFTSFLRLNNIIFYIYIAFLYYLFINHGHLNCAHVLAIVNKAVMNVGKQISLQDTSLNS